MKTNILMKWDQLSPRSKLFVGGGILFVVFIVPILITVTYRAVNSATITLTFAPKSASVKIGASSAQTGDNSVRPGTYDVTVTKQGFATYKQTVTVKAWEKIIVEAALESNDPSTKDWYQKNIEDYTIAQGIGDRKADASYQKMMSNFPIAKVLPIVGLYSTYRVDYGISPTHQGRYAIFISYRSDEYKAQAVAAFGRTGYKLNDYEVIYKKDEPIKQDGVAVTGKEALSARGMSANMVDNITKTLTGKYQNYNNESVTDIVISNVSHAKINDGDSDIYTASLKLNSKFDLKIKIVTTFDTMNITANSPNGSGESVIYSGQREIQ